VTGRVTLTALLQVLQQPSRVLQQLQYLPRQRTEDIPEKLFSQLAGQQL